MTLGVSTAGGNGLSIASQKIGIDFFLRWNGLGGWCYDYEVVDRFQAPNFKAGRVKYAVYAEQCASAEEMRLRIKTAFSPVSLQMV